MIEGNHFQNAYVTRNIQRAIDDFKSRADVRKLLFFEVTTAVVTPAGPGTVTNKLAFIWVEDLQYEFIEPVGGNVSLYRDALPPDESLVFHHTCMRVDNWDDFRGRVRKQSLPVAIEGGSEALRYLYLDARELLGHYLEYVWMTPERWMQVGGR
jgi:Glyoxalase/Bleomycin resistance protein/Dioxygenase superfamily